MTDMLGFSHPDAACRGVDPALFFPGRGDMETIAAAQAVCRECPARRPCLEWALPHEEHDIWGGTTGRDRQRMRRAQGIRLRTPSLPHGANQRESA